MLFHNNSSRLNDHLDTCWWVSVKFPAVLNGTLDLKIQMLQNLTRSLKQSHMSNKLREEARMLKDGDKKSQFYIY